METTRLSSKGQIVIPQPIRDAHHWEVGAQFEVREVENGVLLIPINPHEKKSARDLMGCVGYKGPKKSLKQMEEAIIKEARKKNDNCT